MNEDLKDIRRDRCLEAFHDRFKEPDRLSLAALAAVYLGPGALALEITGFGFRLGLRPDVARVVAIAVGAAFLGFWYTRRRLWAVGVVPGALAGLSIYELILWYTSARKTVWSPELALVAAVGLLPALGLYYLTLRVVVVWQFKRRWRHGDRDWMP